MDPFLSHSDMSLYLGRDYNLMHGHNISVQKRGSIHFFSNNSWMLKLTDI